MPISFLLYPQVKCTTIFLFHRKKPAGRLESLPEDLALVLKNRKNKNGTFCDWFYDWQSNKMKGNSEKVKKSDKKKTKRNP